jgi:phage tail-like protein
MENIYCLFLILLVILIILIIVAGGYFMQRRDPLRNCRFRVEIDGIEQAGMCEVSGIEAAIETVEYREGTDALGVRYMNGMPKYGKLTIKWGITDSLEIYNWFKSGIDGQVEYRQMSIIAIDFEGKDKARWNLINVWPSKYHAPDFNARSNEVAMETLEITYEGIARVN